MRQRKSKKLLLSKKITKKVRVVNSKSNPAPYTFLKVCNMCIGDVLKLLKFLTHGNSRNIGSVSECMIFFAEDILRIRQAASLVVRN